MISWHRKICYLNTLTHLNNVSDILELDQYKNAEIENTLATGRSLIEQTVIGFTPYASKFLVQHQTTDAINFMEKQMEKEATKNDKLNYQNLRINFIKNVLIGWKTNFKRFLESLNSEQVILLESLC